jgi:biopolymer transport protein ExbD
MAEITQNSADEHSDKVRAKRLSTKIDMTPMVDLAFLLLTFFILTTTFHKVRVMQVDMPEKTVTNPPPISDRNILNLVLAENNKVYWWDGLDASAKMTNYSNDGVRKILLEKGKANPNLMVLIKPKDNSKYENIVDILDEMDITNIKKYAIVAYTSDDKIRLP